MREHAFMAKQRTRTPVTATDPCARFTESQVRLLKRVRQMTQEEGFETLVKSGIYTRDGKLTPEYGGRK